MFEISLTCPPSLCRWRTWQQRSLRSHCADISSLAQTSPCVINTIKVKIKVRGRTEDTVVNLFLGTCMWWQNIVSLQLLASFSGNSAFPSCWFPEKTRTSKIWLFVSCKVTQNVNLVFWDMNSTNSCALLDPRPHHMDSASLAKVTHTYETANLASICMHCILDWWWSKSWKCADVV